MDTHRSKLLWSFDGFDVDPQEVQTFSADANGDLVVRSPGQTIDPQGKVVFAARPRWGGSHYVVLDDATMVMVTLGGGAVAGYSDPHLATPDYDHWSSAYANYRNTRSILPPVHAASR